VMRSERFGLGVQTFIDQNISHRRAHKQLHLSFHGATPRTVLSSFPWYFMVERATPGVREHAHSLGRACQMRTSSSNRTNFGTSSASPA